MDRCGDTLAADTGENITNLLTIKKFLFNKISLYLSMGFIVRRVFSGTYRKSLGRLETGDGWLVRRW